MGRGPSHAHAESRRCVGGLDLHFTSVSLCNLTDDEQAKAQVTAVVARGVPRATQRVKNRRDRIRADRGTVVAHDEFHLVGVTT